MKSKAPLALMEQLVMLLVFALAAALCIQVFVLSSRMSQWCVARDRAVTEVQNAAEAVKAFAGDLKLCEALLGGTVEERHWQIAYDENWNTSMVDGAYHLITVMLPSPVPTLGVAEISAQTAGGDILFCVTISWQEVPDE